MSGGDASALLGLYMLAAGVLVLPGVGVIIWQRYFIRRAVQPVPGSIDLLWLKKIGFGLALGCGLLALTILPGVLAGGYSPAATGWQAFGGGGPLPVSTGGRLLIFLLQSGVEELQFRAIYMGLLAILILWLLKTQQLGCNPGGRTLQHRAWLWAGIAASVAVSVAFAYNHAANPGVSTVALANIALAGVLLGLLAWADGDILAAWALHFAWNTGLALLGLPVSGLTDLSSGPFSGAVPGLLTGGGFGPEASAVNTVVLAAAIAFVLWLAVKRAPADVKAAAAEPAATESDVHH